MVQGAVLLLLVAVLVLPVLAVRRLAGDERRVLWLVLAVALALRLAAAVVLHSTGAWQLTGRGAVTPDEATVDLAARLLARGDERSPVVLGGSLHTTWLLVSWSVYDLLWNSLLAIKLLNVLLGTALLVPVYLLARELHSVAAARVAAWLVALFPAAVVWSSLALRESLLALLLTTLVLLAVTRVPPRWSGATAWVGLAATAVVVLAFTRSYMTPLMLVVLLGAAVVRRDRRWPQVAAAAAVAGISLGVITLLPTGVETLRVTVALVAEPAGSVYNPLSDCDRARDCAAAADPRAGAPGGNALPGSVLDSSDAPGDDGDELDASLQSIGQKGVVRAFAIATLAGRPVWRTEEFFLLLQPGVVMWWVLLPTMVVGAGVLARRRPDAAVATAGYAAALVVFLAVTGQFIRHHYMLEPTALALAAVGLVALRERQAVHRPDRRVRAAASASAIMAAGAAISVAASLATG